jgi:hypothetical protein
MDIFHIEIDGYIWEINPNDQKALLRSREGLSKDQLDKLAVVNDQHIEDYIRTKLECPHLKRVRNTKIIYSQYPICAYIAPSPRPDNPDYIMPCEKTAVFSTPKGLRCLDHQMA